MTNTNTELWKISILKKTLLPKKFRPEGRRVGRGEDEVLCNLGPRLNRRDTPDNRKQP